MFVVAGCVAASIDDAIKYTQRKRERVRETRDTDKQRWPHVQLFLLLLLLES